MEDEIRDIVEEATADMLEQIILRMQRGDSEKGYNKQRLTNLIDGITNRNQPEAEDTHML